MRITGGSLRSRALRAPRGTATRPTSDRVREALFGILGSMGALPGARVLDLYAGTGALALEALSRGASEAVLVESSREALAAARANVAALGVEGAARVLACDAREVPRRLAGSAPFDVVFADPPWALVDTGDAPRVLAAVVAAGLVAARGLVVLEHAARSAVPVLDGLDTTQTRRYGDTALTFYKPAILAQPRVDLPGTTSE
ncbi:MAG TPA: 16S rRNA (guanine(966)-N(2))-methyltransferase RsmD [Polyangiaceae bacterium]